MKASGDCLVQANRRRSYKLDALHVILIQQKRKVLCMIDEIMTTGKRLQSMGRVALLSVPYFTVASVGDVRIGRASALRCSCTNFMASLRSAD